MIPDHTIDFAFSFDSLVHADEEAIESYVSQLSTKLKNDGVASSITPILAHTSTAFHE